MTKINKKNVVFIYIVVRKPIFTIWKKKNDNIAGTRKQLVICFVFVLRK